MTRQLHYKLATFHNISVDACFSTTIVKHFALFKVECVQSRLRSSGAVLAAVAAVEVNIVELLSFFSNYKVSQGRQDLSICTKYTKSSIYRVVFFYNGAVGYKKRQNVFLAKLTNLSSYEHMFIGPCKS
jgi:hypothetical protein